MEKKELAVMQFFCLTEEEGQEYCFHIGLTEDPTPAELLKVRGVLSEQGFFVGKVTDVSLLSSGTVVEIGPRVAMATPWSNNIVSIFETIGIENIFRIERSVRYLLTDGQNKDDFIAKNCDRMTQEVYPEKLKTFDTGVKPEKVYEVDLIHGGPKALADIPGISMDEWDRDFYYNYFVGKKKRNPTIVEIMDLNNANSEHSRHGYFKGAQTINGVLQEQTLFEIVTETLTAHPKGSIIAFKDNSSVISGYDVETILPTNPGEPSSFSETVVAYDILLTAETHNFPTGVAPFPGAETGTGGRIRDVQGTGMGGTVIAGTAGYCVGALEIPGYPLRWEKVLPRDENLATPLEIEIQASNGASDYGNKFGEPLILGFTRSIDITLADGSRCAYLKPIMFTGGIGQIDHRHVEKSDQEKGMIIVQVGGPAYRVGFGGGAASSMMQGENATELDFDAVQRGDAEMEQKMNRVIRACNEMGDKTLIDVIHDQGAGGPANVLKELVEDSGGKINIRKIRVADPTMSVLEVYVAEYQERNGFLIRPENLEKFKRVCVREKVGCEVLGEVTGDHKFVVFDSNDGTTPVDIDIDDLLTGMPQKNFNDERCATKLEHFPLERLTQLFTDEVAALLKVLAVGSKKFLTNKADRAVTGLVVQQQCVGPLQLPLANVGVVAQSHFGLTGGATSIGEKPLVMLADPAAGARMAVGEALTNLMWALMDELEQVKCSANWMWAPKLPGEGAAIYDAACAMRDIMIELGIAVDGGKDSLSMATNVDGEIVKSPRQLVISLYAAMKDIRRKVTPDIKKADSQLLLIDMSGGKNRIGGSAYLQTHGHLGNEMPDVDDPAMLKKSFLFVQRLIRENLILSGHDRSDGGLITTIAEMAMGGNCGVRIAISSEDGLLETLCCEELGAVIECTPKDYGEIGRIAQEMGVDIISIGRTTAKKEIHLKFNGREVFAKSTDQVMLWWSQTSYEIEKLQTKNGVADQERNNCHAQKIPQLVVPFQLEKRDVNLITERPKVVILRDEGSNSDREMTSAFYMAGFDPWDITMTDLLEGRVDLCDFRGLVAVGGFSYADVPQSAKGWAAPIMYNDRLREMFDVFYNRTDTFTLGVCNGCQLFGLIGWVPWSGIMPENQPRFVRNISGRFESRWSMVTVPKSNAIMFKGMDGLTFGIHVDHGEGRLVIPENGMRTQIVENGMVPMMYVDDSGGSTEKYPFNPNGSEGGLAGLCSKDGRHLAIMPHPERVFLPWQAHYLSERIGKHCDESGITPWMQMFYNAYDWCVRN